MSIITTSPTLRYVATSDISAVHNGLIKYEIFFDQTVSTLGNIIMFEYKLQDRNTTIPTNDNTSFGYVSIEDATPTGISNQYILSIPALSNISNNDYTYDIDFRVYTGQLDSSDVVVTEWSNKLHVYNPPITPIIEIAYYDPTYNTDQLFVFMKEADNNYDYNTMKFIVSYFFQNDVSNTVWGVSDPTLATLTTIGSENYYYVPVQNIGTVSSTQPNVFVSVHAVYDWQDPSNNNNYYSVSYNSNEKIALPGNSDNTPNITDISYNVYVAEGAEPSVPGNQTINITWEAPGNSGMPLYQVGHYKLMYSVNNGTFNQYLGNLSPTTLTQTVDVGLSGLNLTCGDNIKFKVIAVTVYNEIEPSDESIATNIFKYSQAVTNLTITDISYDNVNNVVGLTVNFTGVTNSNKGCGAGLSYVILINDVVYTATSGSLTYSSGASYSIVYSNLSIAQTGTVKVYLTTQNTNAVPSYSSNMAGVSNSVEYIANVFSLNPVVYQVYNYGNTDQNILLEWLTPSLSGWTVSGYQVQYSINSGSWTNFNGLTTNTTTTFPIDSQWLNSVTNLSFRVIATMTNGSTSYNLTSNVESQNTFTYADAPSLAVVNWAAANQNNSSMDVSITFKNPISNGINDGVQFFRVRLVNPNNVDLAPAQDISYVGGSSQVYNVIFNNATYSASGFVRINSYVRDSNSISDITNDINSLISLSFASGTIPQFINVSSTPTTIYGEIVSNTLPAYSEKGRILFHRTGPGYSPDQFQYNMDGSTPGMSITTTEVDGTSVKTFMLTFSNFIAYTPNIIIIYASNPVGIGTHMQMQ